MTCNKIVMLLNWLLYLLLKGGLTGWTCASPATAPSFSGYPGLRPWLFRLEVTPRSPTHPLVRRGQTRSWPARPRSSRNWTPRAGPW